MLESISFFEVLILNKVQGVLTAKVDWHDVGLATLEIHVFVADCRLMPASFRILDHKLQLGQFSLSGCLACSWLACKIPHVGWPRENAVLVVLVLLRVKERCKSSLFAAPVASIPKLLET